MIRRLAVVLGAAAPGGTVSGQLGAMQVVDTRALLVAARTATVTTTALTTGGATSAEIIPATAVKYASGPATATTGVGVFTPGRRPRPRQRPCPARRPA